MLIKLYKHSPETKCIQLTVVDTRNHLPDIPPNFLGNASAPITTPPFSASASIDEIARIIHETLKPILEKPSQELKKIMALSVNVMNHKLPIYPFDITEMLSKKPTVFHVNNFSKLRFMMWTLV